MDAFGRTGLRRLIRVFASAALVGAVLGIAGFQRASAKTDEIVVGEDLRTALTLTFYSQDLGHISERRKVKVREGDNILAIEDISLSLLPETVSIGGRGITTVDHSFEYLTAKRLREFSFGREVTFVQVDRETGEKHRVRARLVGDYSNPLYEIGGEISSKAPGQIVYSELPEGLRKTPAIVVHLRSAVTGEIDLDVSYLTHDLTWRADYSALLNESEDALDLTATVTLINQSGIRFSNAAVQLVAGDVAEVYGHPRRRAANRGVIGYSIAGTMAAPRRGEPLPAVGRFLYQLAEPISLAPSAVKHVPLMTAEGVEFTREYRFENLISADPKKDETGPESASVILQFENTKNARLGRPLPAGIVRIYKSARHPLETGSGGRVFMGEARLRHVPENEEFELNIGKAFEITGRARRVDFLRIDHRTYETAQQVTLRNAKAHAVEARVVGRFAAVWEMLTESAPHERLTASKIAWTINIPAKGETTLSYRIRMVRY